MSLSGLVRAAWVAVPVALVGGGAVAQQVFTSPFGVVVIVSPGEMPMAAVSGTTNTPIVVDSRRLTPAVPPAGPIERIFAEQQAMMDRMMADMDAMFYGSMNPGGMNAGGMIRAMLGRDGAAPAAGGTFCEESVSVSVNGHDAPVVKVSRTGGGCGPGTGVAPVPAETAPPAPHHPNVIEVNDPVRIGPPSVRHRT